MAKKPHGWYKTLVTRPVVNVDGYERYEKVCGHVADIFFFTNEQKLQQRIITNFKNSENITLYTLYKVGEAKCPAYWVGLDWQKLCHQKGRPRPRWISCFSSRPLAQGILAQSTLLRRQTAEKTLWIEPVLVLGKSD